MALFIRLRSAASRRVESITSPVITQNIFGFAAIAAGYSANTYYAQKYA
jgi:hypothetical protein